MFKRIELKPLLPRIGWDAGMSILALALAFVSRAMTLLLAQGPTDQVRQIIEGYKGHLLLTALPLAVITIGVMAAFGFYQSPKSRRENWHPWFTVAATSMVVVLFTFVMYFTMREPFFSRGVILFFWLYLTSFIALPRIAKFLALRKAVFKVGNAQNEKPRNILVIGGAGYIGSHLVHDLLNKGYRVRVLDSMLFGDKGIKDVRTHQYLNVMVGDFRNVETLVSAMRDMDAVVHLGGIVGDPACSLDDEFTIDVNLTATTFVAEACKIFKIRRLIFASTCSVYGASEPGVVLTEESPLNPVSLYARTKIASEHVLMGQVSDEFCPTILRFSTLFGLSYRPRFDLVVNLLTAKATKEKDIAVFGGNQWRPFVHVRDAGKAIIACLEAPLSKVRGEVFNVGSTEMNFQIVDIGNKVVEHVPGTNLKIDGDMEDARNYHVSFDKLEKGLGVKLSRTIDEGIIEMRDAVLNGTITDYKSPEYSNVSQTQKIITDVNQDAAQTFSPHKKTSKAWLRHV